MTDHRVTKGDVERIKNEMLEQSLLVRVEVAAKIMDCSPRKVMRLVEDGRLCCYNESRQRGLRIKMIDLKHYIASLRIDVEEWRK